ncbi:unnamed protein product, partial [Prorocentrum cordatum]
RPETLFEKLGGRWGPPVVTASWREGVWADRGAGRGAPPAAAAARGRRRAVAERGRGDRLVPAPAAAGGPPGGGDGERLVGRQPQPIARTGDPDGLTMQARAGSEGGPRAVTGRTASSASLTCLAAARPWWPAGRRHSMKMTHSSIGTSSRQLPAAAPA